MEYCKVLLFISGLCLTQGHEAHDSGSETQLEFIMAELGHLKTTFEAQQKELDVLGHLKTAYEEQQKTLDSVQKDLNTLKARYFKVST